MQSLESKSITGEKGSRRNFSPGRIRNGTLKEKRLRFLFKNDKGNSEKARVVTENLIMIDRVRIIMGGYASSEVFPIAITTMCYGVPFLSDMIATLRDLEKAHYRAATRLTGLRS